MARCASFAGVAAAQAPCGRGYRLMAGVSFNRSCVDVDIRQARQTCGAVKAHPEAHANSEAARKQPQGRRRRDAKSDSTARASPRKGRSSGRLNDGGKSKVMTPEEIEEQIRRLSLTGPSARNRGDARDSSGAAHDFPPDPPGHRSGYVAIIGRPNAGKSTLMNRLVGQKLSIVSPKAQTTRHRILGITSAADHQMVLLDTPGVVERRRNQLESRMMAFVRSAMREANALVAIVDATHDATELLQMLQPPSDYRGPPLLVVLNKQDLVPDDEIGALQAWWKSNCRCDAVLTMSALSGEGLDAVRAWMVAQLPEGPTLYPKELVAEQPDRFFVSEIIREHVFHNYSDELPYSVQVNVTDFKERDGRKDYIACDLVCERDSQKGILVGAGGSAIKALATAARADIEAFLGRPVYLDVKVRYEKAWRRNTGTLKRFGY